MEWNEHSDDSLIEYAVSHLQHQGPAAMEMQRRLLDAIREFNTASNRQAATMIRLNRAMTTLTVALLVVGAIQLWAMVKPSGALRVRDSPRHRRQCRAYGCLLHLLRGSDYFAVLLLG